MTPTGRPFDLAIQGDGFFMLSDGSQNQYTRVGSFNLDKNNDLVDSGTGLKVMGTSGVAINVPVNATEAGKATTTTSIAGNLNSEFVAGAVNQVTTSASPYTVAGPAAAVAGSALNDLLQNTTDYVAGDKINIVGTEHDGTTVSKSFVYGSGAGQDGTTLGALSTFLTANFGSATASIDGSGNLVLTADQAGQSELVLNIG